MATAKDLEAELAAAIGVNDDESTVRHFLDTGFPPLNSASSANWKNGLPVGRMVEIAGPASCGKTAIATAAMASAQKAGGIAGFMDHERSFSFDLAVNLGLNVKPGRFVFKKPRTFEESLQMCVTAAVHIRTKKLIAPDAPICWVFDSLASMVPQSALMDKDGNIKSFEARNMNDNSALARATSNSFPAFAQHCEEYGICAIFLNQMRMKIGVLFGDPRKTTGGNAPEFYFSQRLWLSASQIKKGTEVIGMEVSGKFMKNKIARPFRDAKWRFMFMANGSGHFDRERSLVEFLSAQGLLVKQGNSLVWDSKKYPPETLARKAEKEGFYDKLVALLPEKFDHPEAPTLDFESEEATTEAA